MHVSDVLQLTDQERPHGNNVFVCLPAYLEKHTIDF